MSINSAVESMVLRLRSVSIRGIGGFSFKVSMKVSTQLRPTLPGHQETFLTSMREDLLLNSTFLEPGGRPPPPGWLRITQPSVRYLSYIFDDK